MADQVPPGWRDKIMHATLQVGDAVLMGSDAPPQHYQKPQGLFVSVTVVGWAAVLYYGVAVHTRGFGSYKQLLPLMVFQVVLVQSIAVAGILLAIAGFPNIYAAPEYSGPPFARSSNQWAHVLAH